MRRKRIKSTGDELVDELMARFRYAWENALKHFERMERIQQAYDNHIDTVNWPTISEISIPLTFSSVEEQLPFAMKYLFNARNRWIELVPYQKMERKKVIDLEDDLNYTVKVEMDTENAALPSIRDCYKFAVGYGLIDTEYITPPEVFQMVANNEAGDIISKIPQIMMGKARQVPCYTYVPPICVVPMPDGANVEGTNRASGHFVLVLKTESQLRDMFAEKGLDGKPILTGDPEEIIEDANNMNFDCRMPPADIMFSLSGVDLTMPSADKGKNIPCVIPILRWYEDHHHVWIANGNVKIYEVKDKYQTFRSDLVKWSAWPDGLRWFPLGVTEASERVSTGVNIWYNGLIDLAMYHLNPTRLINTRMMEDPRSVPSGPRADVKVIGDVRQAFAYAELPQFPQPLFEMGNILRGFHSSANALPQGMQNGSPGLVRGGVNALEAFMSTSTARQFMAAMILKTGGLKPLVEKTLIKKQLMIGEDGEKFVQPAYDPRTGKKIYEEKTITLEDMRHVFRVELDLPVARLNNASALMERQGYFDRAQKNPELFDQRALYSELAEDENLVRRTMLPEEVVSERQDKMANARIQSARTNAMPQEVPPAPPGEGMQALAGMMNGGDNAGGMQ